MNRVPLALSIEDFVVPSNWLNSVPVKVGPILHSMTFISFFTNDTNVFSETANLGEDPEFITHPSLCKLIIA